MLLTSNKPQHAKARDFAETIAMLDGAAGKTESGVFVNSKRAMQQSTVYACVRVVSEIIAQLPIEVQTRKGGQWITAEQHDILKLLAEPNEWQTQHDLISTLISWVELEGNSYLYKIRDGGGTVRRVLPLEADQVDANFLEQRELTYTVISEELGIAGEFKNDRIFHMRNFGTRGYMGMSTISAHRNGIGLALQLENHANSAYKNGLQSNKWVKLLNPLNGEPLEGLKKELRKYSGAAANGEMPALYNAELMEFKGISAVDAQYIESRRMQKEEIATMFLVPVFLLNSTENTTWGSGLEQISRSFVRFSLNPRLNRLAQTLVREFIPESARARTRIVFDTDQFTLGEFKERMEGYRHATESGVLSANECREIENRNPRDGGDKYRQPANILIEGEANENQDITE